MKMDVALSKISSHWLLVAIAVFLLEPWIEIGSALLFGFTLEHHRWLDLVAPVFLASLWVQIYGAQTIYAVVMFLLWPALIGVVLLLAGLFIRKLVLDAVREAKQ